MNFKKVDRRQFLKLAGVGGVAFASGLTRSVTHAADASAYMMGTKKDDDFFFVQLTDPHWGFSGPKVNPHADTTLKKAIAAVNALKNQPDFIMFTGDLTHTTDDDKERRRRLKEFKAIVSELKVKNVRFIPGEHDASLDEGAAYKEFFGPTHYSFSHKGVNFLALDNVSDPTGSIGDEQIAWMKKELEKFSKNQPLVVFAHRPLFDLAPDWDWATKDGSNALTLLEPYSNVTVFYGHIHQEHHHVTGHINHHAATSLIFPLPAPMSVAKKAPIPWDEKNPYKGLGYREVKDGADEAVPAISEIKLKG
jgi:Calcineurin-like phosphoesterase